MVGSWMRDLTRTVGGASALTTARGVTPTTRRHTRPTDRGGEPTNARNSAESRNNTGSRRCQGLTPVRAVSYLGTHDPGTVLLSSAGVHAMLRKCGMDNAYQLHRVIFDALRVVAGARGMVMVTKALLAVKPT